MNCIGDTNKNRLQVKHVLQHLKIRPLKTSLYFFLILIFWIFFAQLVIRFFSETMLDQQKGTPYNEL
jgi:hypothetical protein